jgi:anti-sigma B factor antagonist
MKHLELVTRTAMSNTAVSVLDIDGVLDINTVDNFENALQECLKKKQYKIILNLEKLTYISSAGIGVLVGNIKEIRKNRGDIKLAGASPEVYNVLDLLDLPGLFKIHKTERDAAAEF